MVPNFCSGSGFGWLTQDERLRPPAGVAHRDGPACAACSPARRLGWPRAWRRRRRACDRGRRGVCFGLDDFRVGRVAITEWSWVAWTFVNLHAIEEQRRPRRLGGGGGGSRAEVRMACSILDLSWRTHAAFVSRSSRRGGRGAAPSKIRERRRDRARADRDRAPPMRRRVSQGDAATCGPSSPPGACVIRRRRCTWEWCYLHFCARGPLGCSQANNFMVSRTS